MWSCIAILVEHLINVSFNGSLNQLFSRSVVSDSLLSHELQHARLSCPSPSPGVCSNSCPLSQCKLLNQASKPFMMYPCKYLSASPGLVLSTHVEPKSAVVTVVYHSVSPTKLRLWTPILEHRVWNSVKWSEVAQSCPALCDPMDCSLLCSSVHGIFQARVLKWVSSL